MIELVQYLVQQLPDLQFVLRPHPFENTAPYEIIAHDGNFQIRQEATSVEWVNHALALIHLNCSTALEARMLGVPAISPAWLDTDEIRIPGPYAVSQHSETREQVLEAITSLSAVKSGFDDSRGGDALLRQLYFRIDGKATERVCDAIIETINRSAGPVQWPLPKGRAVWLTRIRGVLGYKLSTKLVGLFSPQKRPESRASKYFSVDQVRAIVSRLGNVDPIPQGVSVSPMTGRNLVRAKMASGHSICVHPIHGEMV